MTRFVAARCHPTTLGWDSAHAAGCEAAIEILRREGDPLTLKLGLANYHLVLLSSSRYHEAYEAIVAGLEALEANAGDSSFHPPMAHWYLRASAPVCLLYAGRLGPAFETARSTLTRKRMSPPATQPAARVQPSSTMVRPVSRQAYAALHA